MGKSNSTKRGLISLFLVIIFFSSQNIFSQEQNDKIVINSSIENIVRTLASEGFEGRAPQTKGDTLTAAFVSNFFQNNGIKPLLKDYFQEVSYKDRVKNAINKDSANTLTYSRNVIGIIEGSDKNLKNEYIIIGAHMDHLGMGGSMSGSRIDSLAVHYGADDNASGVALMLDLAKKFKNKPSNRSLIFIAFAGEEKGLVGSKGFVNNLPFDKNLINAMFNFDMVGNLKNNSITAGGSKTSSTSEELIIKHAQNHNLKPSLSPNGHGPSDHSSFYAQNIPVFYFTTGADDTYHTPRDNADRINYKGIELLSNFTFDLIKDIANNKDRLVFQEAGSATQETGRASFKITLGIMPDVTGSTENGLKADVVIKDRPAYKAGLQNGDIIIEIDSVKVKDINDYMKCLASLKADSITKVKVIRGSEVKEIEVKL